MIKKNQKDNDASSHPLRTYAEQMMHAKHWTGTAWEAHLDAHGVRLVAQGAQPLDDQAEVGVLGARGAHAGGHAAAHRHHAHQLACQAHRHSLCHR